jgi:hypothetical protein
VDTVALPFGKHKDEPLDQVPSSYLCWLIREAKLSSGLRQSVAGELNKRGMVVPKPPPAAPIPSCSRCGGNSPFVFWMEDSRGNRRLSARCSLCRKHLKFPPIVEPFIAMANQNASQTPILDVLTRLDELGMELQSDGVRAWVKWEDSKRVPQELLAIVSQCSHQLARMLGNKERSV